jgi:hypothetical protein
MPPKTAKGIPIYVWAGAGIFAIIIGYFFLRPSSAAQSTAQTQGAAGDATSATLSNDQYAAMLNQYSWLNSYLAQISQQIAGIGSTQGGTAQPPPTPKPPPTSCCPPGKGILCKIGESYCAVHDGSGVIPPGGNA